jgi:hypothetical protein
MLLGSSFLRWLLDFDYWKVAFNGKERKKEKLGFAPRNCLRSLFFDWI